MNEKELRAEIAKAHEAGEAILKDARTNGWTDENRATFDKTHAHMGELQETLNAATRQAVARANIMDRHELRLDDNDRDSDKSLIARKAIARDIEDHGPMRRFKQYLRGGFESLTAEDRALYAAETRTAQGIAPDAAGGFLVPEQMWPSLTEAILAFGGMRQARTTVLRTSGGNPLTLPQVDDTAISGTIKAENVAADEVAVTFAEQVLGAFTYSSGSIKISEELLSDNEIGNFEQIMAGLLGTRIGRKQNTDFTLGAGTTLPFGVVTGAAVGVAAAVALTKDVVLDLIHSLDAGFAAQTEIMVNYATLGELRKLESTTEIPIWNDTQLGTPARLYGLPIIVNQDIADIASASIPMIAGDFSRYWIRDVWPITVRRSTEIYWLDAAIGMLGLARADGVLNNPGDDPIKKVTMAV